MKKKTDTQMNMAVDVRHAPLLVNCGFDVNILRARQLAANATVLRDDEYKYIDSAVVQICRQRLVIVNDLVSAGLTIPLTNGLGKMVFEYEDISDMSDAAMSMAAEAADTGDRVEFTQKYLPLPVTHHGFSINARALEASRTGNTPLDVTQAQIAAIKVSEKIETTFAAGCSSFAYGGGTIYGILDYVSKQSYTVAAHWNDSGADPLDDLLGMKALSTAAHHYGPWMFYIPPNWESVIDEDLKAASDKSLYQRLKEVRGIIDVKVCDKFTNDYCALVEFQPTTIVAVVGLQPTTLDWQSMGGLVSHFKVIAIIVPLIRTDQAGNSGIIVGTR